MKRYSHDLRQKWSQRGKQAKIVRPTKADVCAEEVPQFERMLHKEGGRAAAVEQGSVDVTETSPGLLSAADIRRLLCDSTGYELDHLTRQAAQHAATLRQMNRRLSELSAPVGLQENLGHAHAQWKHRLEILSMVADARGTLARNTEPERAAVEAARVSLRSSASGCGAHSTRLL